VQPGIGTLFQQQLEFKRLVCILTGCGNQVFQIQVGIQPLLDIFPLKSGITDFSFWHIGKNTIYSRMPAVGNAIGKFELVPVGSVFLLVFIHGDIALGL